MVVQNDKPIIWQKDAQIIVDGGGPPLVRRLNTNGSVDSAFIGPTNRVGAVYRDGGGVISTVVIGDF